jgi:hypothetical protein
MGRPRGPLFFSRRPFDDFEYCIQQRGCAYNAWHVGEIDTALDINDQQRILGRLVLEATQDWGCDKFTLNKRTSFPSSSSCLLQLFSSPFILGHISAIFSKRDIIFCLSSFDMLLKKLLKH